LGEKKGFKNGREENIHSGDELPIGRGPVIILHAEETERKSEKARLQKDSGKTKDGLLRVAGRRGSVEVWTNRELSV